MDREKVIKNNAIFGLRSAIEIGGALVHLRKEHAKAILELLKEQEAVEPTWQQGKAYCGACGKRIPLKIGARFCHKCGIPILWEGRFVGRSVKMDDT